MENRSFDIVNPNRYACPDKPELQLIRNGNILQSADGSVSYNIQDDVARFLKSSYRESDRIIDEMHRLNTTCLKLGWESALREVYPKESGIHRYVTDPQRLKFFDLLQWNKQSVVLELGPGLGPFTAAIADQVGFVYALEISPGQAQFVLERCHQTGANNVSVACGGEDCRLPYINDSFDFAIINLVFEWCAEKQNTPETGQQLMLSELFRTLKHGGTIYLNTKNRFSLRHLTNGMAGGTYGATEGGRLRKLVLTLQGKERSMGTVHSHNYLSKMLKDAGYSDVRSFWAAPEMRYPASFIPTGSKSVRMARRNGEVMQGDTRATRLLMPLVPAAWVKHVTPGLTFVARKA